MVLYINPVNYFRLLQIGTPKIIGFIVFKNGTVWIYNAVMHLKDPDEMANSVDLIRLL